MRLPYLNEINNSRQSIINFLGLNYSKLTKAGELEDCVNLSTNEFPHMTQRPKKALMEKYAKPNGLIVSNNQMVMIDGERVLVNGEKVGEVEDNRKKLASVGKYVVIFPDKKYYDIEEKVFGDMEETYVSKEGEISFKATSDGTEDGIKYATLTTTGENFKFRKGDAIEISGCTVNPENNQTIIIREVSNKVLKFYENSFTAGKETGKITIKRSVPDLEFICESNYRLWGCSGNTIYGSKYSDPFNFQVFDGLTGDSYYIDVGTDGDFTGCIAYSSYICFFKEECVHKLYGSKPSNFQLTTSNAYGVQSGCERTICNINETLYYLGKNGIYAFNGGLPELISENFGAKRFTNGCAGTDGENYYISMSSIDGSELGVYVYDIKKGIWLKSYEDKAVAFAYFGYYNDLFYVTSEGNLYAINGDRWGGYELEDSLTWSATLCKFNETINERKGYSKLSMRVELEKDAWLKVEVKTDNDAWKSVYTTVNDKAQTILVPIFPNRCDSFKVRLSGKGKCSIKSFVRDFYVGSEV